MTFKNMVFHACSWLSITIKDSINLPDCKQGIYNLLTSSIQKRLISDTSNANQIVKSTKDKAVPNGIYLLDLKHEGSSVQNNKKQTK